MPLDRFPWFSVTLLTANALACQDRIRLRWSRLTRRKSFSSSACAMRICAFPTNSMTCFQSMECQSVGPLGDAALLPVCSIPFSDEVRPIEEGTDPEGQIPSGSLISRSGLTLPHLRQVCSLSLRHDLSDPLQTGIRFLPLPLPPPHLPLITRGLPTPRGAGVSGAYLVSPDAQSGGYRTDGVRDSNIRRRSYRERTAIHDMPFQTWCRFGRSSPPRREASVSCSLLTTVLA